MITTARTRLLLPLALALHASGCGVADALFVRPVRDLFVSDETRVASRDYDALWDATYAVLSQYAPVRSASQEEGFIQTEPRTSRASTSATGHAMPGTVDSTLRMQARFYPRDQSGKVNRAGIVRLELRVYEELRMPHQTTSSWDGARRERPQARQHLVNYGSTSTRSQMREQMALAEIAQELNNRVGVED